MKLELKENMYIRTNEGIRKILNEFEEGYELDRCLHYCYLEGHDLYKKDLEDDEDKIVTKSSFNIIDILEEGDYINGVEIIKIYEKGDSFEGNRNYIFKEKTIEVANDNYETIPAEALFINKEIETIVTHEQMEQMAYKVEE